MHFFAVAVLVLALVSATGALASLGGSISQSLDVAAHFTPLWALGSLIAIGLGLALGPAGRESAALGLGGTVICAWLMAPDLIALRRRRVPAQPGRTIKLVQLNLWRWNVDPDGTIAWLSSEDAEVVVVQEVTDWAAGIPAALAQHYPHQAEIHTGTQILSRLPILEHGAYRARSTRTHSTGAWASLDHPSGPFTVVGFQATWPIPPGLQQEDSADLAALLDRFDRRCLIVCGDFNSTPWSGALRRQDRLFAIERRSRAMLTWPVQPYTQFKLTSPLPFLALDHIYAGPDWRTVDVRLGPRLGSDHLPVIAVLAR
jgi:endonuclease/exonuclease/phosphatase (EEP) superfamily protein YafD